jgi:hypothetical protein
MQFHLQTSMLGWRTDGKGKGKAVHLHAMKVYGGAEVQLHSSSTLALDGGVTPIS